MTTVQASPPPTLGIKLCLCICAFRSPIKLPSAPSSSTLLACCSRNGVIDSCVSAIECSLLLNGLCFVHRLFIHFGHSPATQNTCNRLKVQWEAFALCRRFFCFFLLLRCHSLASTRYSLGGTEAVLIATLSNPSPCRWSRTC